MFTTIFRKIQFYFYKIRFYYFQISINGNTKINHNNILEWCTSQKDIPVTNESSEIVKLGQKLRQKVLSDFSNKFIDSEDVILIHLPSKEISPGGYSLFINMIDSFSFIGIKSHALNWDESFEDSYRTYKPTIFLSSDNLEYKSKIDWDFVLKCKEEFNLKVGLTASLEEYGNTSLKSRLEWAINKIDFFYSFRAPEYFNNRLEYRLFNEYGFKILTVEFGANPLYYYPVESETKDLDYVFLASSNLDKQKTYFNFLPNIVKEYCGFINGPGWNFCSKSLPREFHRFAYARAKIGLNLHIDDSLFYASELNERTYILAACGIPQLIDNPKLLSYRFSKDAVMVANNSDEYSYKFRWLLSNHEEANKMAINALEEVYNNHTSFHRAENFYIQLQNLI